ncbi:hypothetical protein QCA50_009832 [Cerrena zonata]|uniref:Uncharacterized protein n=1 Tax=Cerrena zonata TaxID=2478898 RepID=A0AAW0G2S1_9APHY
MSYGHLEPSNPAISMKKYKDSDEHLLSHPPESGTLARVVDATSPDAYAVISTQFSGLQKREETLRSIPSRLGIFEHSLAQHIEENWTQVNDGLDNLNLKDVAGRFRSIVDNIRVIINDTNSHHFSQNLDINCQKLQQQSAQFHISSTAFKASCESLICFLEDQAEHIRDCKEVDHRSENRTLDLRRGFSRLVPRTRRETRRVASESPPKVIRAMITDCEAFMGDLRLFSNLFNQVIQEIAKYKFLVSHQDGTQDHALLGRLAEWLKNMQSILQNYQ